MFSAPLAFPTGILTCCFGTKREAFKHFWDELVEQPDKQDMRYVLTLLLIRRRVFRLEEEKYDPQGRELLVVYCPRRETTYQVPAVPPEAARIDRIQEELATLLQ